jgi:hypothetical protein
MRPTFDDTDADLLAARLAKRSTIEGPRVGDWIEMLDGTLRRFTHDHGEHGLQTTAVSKNYDFGPGSFHLHRSGFMDYSGALDPCVKRQQIEDTGRTAPAPCWFFHHDMARAHNGVTVEIECRIYRQTRDLAAAAHEQQAASLSYAAARQVAYNSNFLSYLVAAEEAASAARRARELMGITD